jgi:hypothetical protein
MNSLSQKTRKGAAVAVALATLSFGAAALSSTSAEAGWRRHHGGAVAVGVIGALALGAMAASAAHARPVPGYDPYYHPVRYRPACYWTRVRERVSYDTVVIRRVRVCD